ncbi:unnamed protein product [[Actinomadura] parvosata subsp. kistnae]|uniref:Uncharacterized protein n=1 Tax=[Actinomadura] parvosata subsp. kistnae TaxID=1909395 RepID=A0A1V0AGV8_9ACTN|nr:hypothetical protein [Nonomuraea sp. ATCC 55076]AQZ69322.1 hypothetical protein BKM31_54695 [Nonomuraea sp. ATCC 55076]SPL92044.1 unnamed protein product [Actinomadura parvosata subsp. kistnae]
MKIADLARVRDEDLDGDVAGQASGAGARALMESIMETAREPVPNRSGRRRVMLRRGLAFGPVAAALAAALVVWTPFGGPATQYANAAVSLKTADDGGTGGDVIEVEINDPGADAGKFTEAFRAIGLDVEVRQAPVAPEDVGKLIGPELIEGSYPKGAGITISTREEGCRSAWCGKVSIPVGVTGRILVGIGRPAAPGELYATPVQIDVDPGGGVIKKYDPRNKPVARVRADLEAAGMKVGYVVMWDNPDGTAGGYAVDPANVKDEWLVQHVERIASDAVTVFVAAPAGLPKDSLPMIQHPSPDWWQN